MDGPAVGRVGCRATPSFTLEIPSAAGRMSAGPIARSASSCSSSPSSCASGCCPSSARTPAARHAGEGPAATSRSRSTRSPRRRSRSSLAERAPRIAFYSEDRGLVAPPDATARAGRRPDRRHAAGDGRARVGLRGGRAGAARRRRADDGRRVELGCVVEIKTRRLVPGRAGRRRAVARGRSAVSTDDRRAADVLGLRLPRAAGAPDGRGARPS